MDVRCRAQELFRTRFPKSNGSTIVGPLPDESLKHCTSYSGFAFNGWIEVWVTKEATEFLNTGIDSFQIVPGVVDRFDHPTPGQECTALVTVSTEPYEGLLKVALRLDRVEGKPSIPEPEEQPRCLLNQF